MNVQVVSDNKDRKYYFDILKIIAIYLVMLNHTGSDAYFLFAESVGSRWYGVYLFISMGIKIAVPIFFMISGALLLPKIEFYADLFKRRIVKYFAALLVFSFLQYLWSIGFQLGNISMTDFATGFYSKPYAATYWYLYAYLAMLLMLPMLRKLAVGMDNTDFLWLFLLRVFTVSVLPLLQYFAWNDVTTLYHEFNVVIAVEDLIFYPLMGYYLDAKLDIRKVTRRHILLCSTVSIILMIVECILTHFYGIYSDSMYVEKFHYTFIYFPAIVFFVIVKKLVVMRPLSAGISRVVSIMGGTTFGIMLLEAPIRNKSEFICDALQNVVGDMTGCMLWIAVCFVIGMVVTLVLKCLPVFRKLV